MSRTRGQVWYVCLLSLTMWDEVRSLWFTQADRYIYGIQLCMVALVSPLSLCRFVPIKYQMTLLLQLKPRQTLCVHGNY